MKVLIIGLGSIAKKHVSVLKAIDTNVQVFALRSSKVGNDYDDVNNIYSYEDILNVNPDFIIISNPTVKHYETLRKIVKYRIPLFIEKPLFSSIGEKQESLINDILDSNIPNYVACNLRFQKGIVEMKNLLKDKKIEEVNIYCGSYLPDWRKGVNFREVYSANKEMGGGVHIDLIHELDYLYWTLGNPLKTHGIFKNNSSLKITSYDYANYIWEYETFCANIILNYYRRDPKRTFEVLTDEGTFNLNLLNGKITFNNNIIFASSQTDFDVYYAQMTFFIESILTEKQKFNNIQESYKILKLCLKN